jgi:hypothetical protein
VTFRYGKLSVADIVSTINQNFVIGFQSYGTTSFAGNGSAGQGGQGVNGGGGGGGYLGGGGGNQNIGGNGSSLVVGGINNSTQPSTVPYKNQWSTTYGSPRLAGGWIVIELRVNNSVALNVTGDVAITGSETVGGGLTVAGSIQGNSNIQTLANLLVNGGIYGANSSTAPTFPVGLTSTNITASGSVTINGTGNSLNIPNGSLIAAGVQTYSPAGFTTVTSNTGGPAQFPLGIVGSGGNTPVNFPQGVNITGGGGNLSAQLNSSLSQAGKLLFTSAQSTSSTVSAPLIQAASIVLYSIESGSPGNYFASPLGLVIVPGTGFYFVKGNSIGVDIFVHWFIAIL